MPRHLISDAHEWINEIPTVPIYYLAKPQPRERTWQNQRGKKTLNLSCSVKKLYGVNSRRGVILYSMCNLLVESQRGVCVMVQTSCHVQGGFYCGRRDNLVRGRLSLQRYANPVASCDENSSQVTTVVTRGKVSVDTKTTVSA